MSHRPLPQGITVPEVAPFSSHLLSIVPLRSHHPMAQSSLSVETLTGTIQSILTTQSENGWVKCTVALPNREVVVASGTLPPVKSGSRVKLIGTWSKQTGSERTFHCFKNSKVLPPQAAPMPADGTTRTLIGTVEEIQHHKEDTGWSVFSVYNKQTGESFRVVGIAPQLTKGQLVKVHGQWSTHAVYGSQFSLSSIEPDVPASTDDIHTLLSSGLVKDIGAKRADILARCFGDQLLSILNGATQEEIKPGLTKRDQAIATLATAKGIGEKYATKLVDAWQEQLDLWPVLAALKKAGFGHTLAYRIYKHYGNKTLTLLQQNPYRFARDVDGVGFEKADRAFQSSDQYNPYFYMRLEQGLLWTIEQSEQQGHTCMPLPELLSEAATRLKVKPEPLQVQLQKLMDSGTVVAEKLPHMPHPYIYRHTLHEKEQEAARILREMIAEPASRLETNTHDIIRQAETSLNVTFTQSQRRAVELGIQRRLAIVTGPPGVGKSLILLAFQLAFEEAGLRVALTAPTGRAAQRMSEATGATAQTIHRLLEYNPMARGFQRNESNPIEADVIVIDETSMMDLALLYSLLTAMAPGTRMVFIGDRDQLPSVSPGAVLRDLIASGRVPVVELTQIFRQSQQSVIVTNAHAIRRGQPMTLLPLDTDTNADCRFIDIESPEQAQDHLRHLFTEFLPGHGFRPDHDVQLLTPMHRGPLGSQTLNPFLQSIQNASGRPLHQWTYTKNQQQHKVEFRQGDRVLQTKNNYDLDIFNGDIGTITGGTDQHLLIQFGSQIVEYPKDNLTDLTLSYAMTIHKSQGSEFPVVILLISNQHYIMLERNLLYTGLTRARRLAIVIGTKYAISQAIKTVKAQNRYGLLQQRLQIAPTI